MILLASLLLKYLKTFFVQCTTLIRPHLCTSQLFPDNRNCHTRYQLEKESVTQCINFNRRLYTYKRENVYNDKY